MSKNPIIKICGIKTLQLLEATISAGADMVGFVHFAKSPRHLELEAIRELIGAASGRVETVILLVNPDEALLENIGALGPDFVQLHGSETIADVEGAKTISGAKIIKALPVGGPEDLATIPSYETVADRIILDAKPPEDATRPGGLGVVFDWELLKSLDPDLPFMLSAGLDADNVADAVKKLRPFGLDVSTGVERAPGEKDEKMIVTFIDNARAAARTL